MGSRSIKGRYSTKTSHKKTGVLVVLSLFVAVVIAGVIGVIGLCTSWLQEIPDYSDADSYNDSHPTVFYANDGQTVLAEFQLENRVPVDFKDISPLVIKGTVATEDERFYEHNGIDFPGIARAVVNNLVGGNLEGASTITMQFVRNTFLSDEMSDITLKRKVREAYIAMKLEEQYSKDEILLMYLNTINYGSGCYGIEAASQRYFSKNASDLTLNEAAILIGIPQSPTYNNPLDQPENCLVRRNIVLDRMVSNNVVTQEEADAAKAEPLGLNPSPPPQVGILAYPYFTSYVRNQLLDPNGKYAYTSNEILRGGLSVYTTLDVDIQNKAERAAERKADQAGSVYEVAMAAIDPDNGYIKAIVGGEDFETNQVNMATGEGGSGRQPGSSFKTFTLVAAIEQGISPNTMIDAGRTATFSGWKVSNNNMVNYGTRSIASAFAVSSNTAFARLCMSLGPSKVAETAHRMGITSHLEETGAITLGASSVSPLEMADAYATIANGGTHYPAECVEKIVDYQGNVIVDNTAPQGEQVLAPEVASAAIDVMRQVITTGTGKDAALRNGQDAAGKTGTSENYKDSWFCGITPQLSVAIWLGDRDDYSLARSVPSSVTAASAFAWFMNDVLAGQPTEKFPVTENKPQYNRDFYDNEYSIGGYYGSGDYDADSKAYDSTPSSGSSSRGNNSSYDDDDSNYSGGSSGYSGGYSGGGGESSYDGSDGGSDSSGGDYSSDTGSSDVSSGGGESSGGGGSDAGSSSGVEESSGGSEAPISPTPSTAEASGSE